MFINVLFILSSVLTILGAILVGVTRNIIHACFYLLLSLLGVAGLYITLGADFIAAVQIIVYAGGVVILMLFSVMLTGGRDFMKAKELELSGKAPFMGNIKTYAFGLVGAFIFLLTTFKLLSTAIRKERVAEDAELFSSVEALGESLLTNHVLVFEFSSVLLLGALIGAAIIARPRHQQKPGDNN